MHARLFAAAIASALLVGCGKPPPTFEDVPPADELYQKGQKQLEGTRYLWLIPHTDYEEAIAMSGRLAHTDHHLRALLFRDLARAHEALGHRESAIEHLERSLDEYDASSEETGDGKAETTLALARLVPDAARGRALALLALELARQPSTRAQIEAHIAAQMSRSKKRALE